MAEQVTSRIDIEVRSKGVDPEAMARKLNSLAGAEDAAANSAEKLTRASDTSARVRERDAKAVDRILRARDEEYKVTKRLADEMAILQRARNAGMGGNPMFERAFALVKQEQDKHTKSVNDNTKAVKLNGAEWANLSSQVQDIFVTAQSGMNPLTIALQQGSQIFDVFSRKTDGAVSGLKAMGGMALSVATNPLTLIVAGIGSATYATLQWQRSVAALTVSLNGLGQASGLTAQGASGVAERTARAVGISNSAARGFAAQMLGAGVRGDALDGGIGITRDFGRKLGLSEDDAASTLANALADPARGAEELSKKYGILSFAQREQIIQTANMGDKSGAAAKLVAVLASRLSDMEDPTWRITKAFDALKTSLSNSLDSWGQLLSDPTGFFSGKKTAGQLSAEQNAQRNATRAALDEALTRQLGLDKVANDAAFAAREITAQTYAQREAVAMEKARVQTLRDTKDATMATMAAESERLRLLAEAQRRVDDYVRTGQRDRAISGARTPYERGRLQIIQENEEMIRNIPTTSPAPRRVRTPAPANDVGALSGGTQDLIAEAQRRGMELSESNFQKLMDEGVGSNKFRGRMVRMDEGFTQSTVDVPNVNRAALEKRTRAEGADRLRAYDQAQEGDFTYRVNQDIEAQNRLLDANAAAFGKSAGETERARKEQELINQAKQQGLPTTESLTRAVQEQSERYGELAQRQEDMQRSQQRVIENFDLVRSSATDSLSSFASDILRGKSAVDSLNGSLMNIADRLIALASSRAIEQIFGQMGRGNLGGGGGIFSSLLSIFGYDTGGVIGVHGRPMMAPASAFRGAPSYDRGGSIGAPVPMIGHVGEIVLNAAMQRNMASALRGGGGGGINIIDQRGANAPALEAKETTDNMGRRRTEVVIRDTVIPVLESPQGRASVGNNFAVKPRVARR
jgi:phage-related minor tail protein